MNLSDKKMGTLTRLLVILAGVLLVISIFKPIWRIELDAPQYPEGLVLLIHANQLGGNVDIINGLNHYIGMGTLHTEDFIEFILLPYLIGFFAIVSLFVAIVGKRKGLAILLAAFILFGVIAMVDFWRWEYNYGHNLDPNAAIIVPGMAYQPPLIGFKQLLNFGAYSIPDIGGWLFISSGILMLFGYIWEVVKMKKMERQIVGALAILITVFTTSCGEVKFEPIKLNKDNCDNCGMTIADLKFAAELVTEKGRVYKFDDVSCLLNYIADNKDKVKSSKRYVSNYSGTNELISVETSTFVQAEGLSSPMGGNIATFENKEDAKKCAIKFQTEILTWETINKSE